MGYNATNMKNEKDFGNSWFCSFGSLDNLR